MTEEFLDQSPAQFDWKKYWAIARRRTWYFVLPFFLGWFLVWGVTWFIPSAYRSGTLILVENPGSVLEQSRQNEGLQDRLESITQQALSRTRLLHIIDSLNLYADERSRGKSDDELVEKMRKNIDIELVRSADKELSSFNIFFLAGSPDVAQQVTTELTNILITENLENTSDALRRQTQFLDSQLEEARTNLSAQEGRVRVFKDQHLGELPGQLQSNIQILSGLQSQLQAEQDALGRAKQQNAYLESLLSQSNTLISAVKSGDPAPSGLPAIERELERLRAQLADLSSRYTEQHPDVRKTKEQLAKTERLKEQLTADLKATGSDPQAAAVATDLSGPRPPLLEIRSQLKANQIEIANRQRAVDNLGAQIATYQSRLNRTPVREQELADLTRDYDQSRLHYESLLDKKNQSKLLENQAKQQQGERFRMMDPPSRPTKPFSPNRFQLSFLGLLAGVVLGGCGVGAAEMLDDRIYDEEVFKQLLPVDVIVEIPKVATTSEEENHTRGFWMQWTAVGIMCVLIVLGTAISYLRG